MLAKAFVIVGMVAVGAIVAIFAAFFAGGVR